ncbi:hypothetical protein CPB84DRAFT_1690596, partial [Gymnopilus junonius]
VPPHLQACVHAFSSNLSEAGKQQYWAQFQKGEICILYATDAARIGCNVLDIQYIVTFNISNSLSMVF